MNTQIAYERIREWFVTPKHDFAFDMGVGDCVYRGEGNLRCAVGAVLPDKLYNEDMEGMSVQGISDRFKSVANFFRNTSMSFLVDVQRLHDDCAKECLNPLAMDETEALIPEEVIFQRGRFIDGLDSLARKYNLNLVTT